MNTPSTPTLSVIVPVYNVADYLPACLDSILGQTFTDFELLLIDDGSTDRSGAICDDYARRDARIRAVHRVNAGVSAARNAGLDMARGEFITFVDSDDALGTPDTLAENLRLLTADPETDIVQFPAQTGDKPINANYPPRGFMTVNLNACSHCMLR